MLDLAAMFDGLQIGDALLQQSERCCYARRIYLVILTILACFDELLQEREDIRRLNFFAYFLLMSCVKSSGH